MAYIEPCCCDRQLPRLLREQKMAFFQTSGDVTVKHLMKSVGCMVKNGSTMWLVALSVDRDLLELIRYWISREWIAQVKIVTHENCEDMVIAELGAVTGLQHTGRVIVEYGQDETLSGGMLVFEDKKNAVVIQGDMLTTVSPGIKLYSGCFGASEGACVKGVMDVARAFAKSRVKAVGEAVAGLQSAEKKATTGLQSVKAKVSPQKRKKKTVKKG